MSGMIGRIQLLRNIGQFDSVSTGATIALARLTLVYSENGRGKTTLAAILRSLATGDPLPITERRRLAAVQPPHVVLECTGGPPPAIFQNNVWNRTLPSMMIFDDIFVDENVHSGLAVQAHHRQNLHELILGAPAVALNRQLQESIARIETHNHDLRAKERAIPSDTMGPYSVEEFCSLPTRQDIDSAILAAERTLAAAREQDVVRDARSFESIPLPHFDTVAIEQLLARDLPALDSATLARLEVHFTSIGEGGEAWVANGVRRFVEARSDEGRDTCPFCAQDLRASPMIRHYRAYFGEEYASLKRDVSSALAALDQIHDREVPAGFERTVRFAIERRQFWSRFCEVPDVTLDTAAIVRDWQLARKALASQLAAKQAAPLEPSQLSAHSKALVAVFERHRETVAAVNHALQNANETIEILRERVGSANLFALGNDLRGLKAVKARAEPTIARLCAEYLEERASKQATERQRDETRTTLELHRTSAFPGYQIAINLYLERFNAGFRLNSVTYANTRGGPTCTYDVLINNTAVSIGPDYAHGLPSFRNTLSGGDRNALALAFFFASLDQVADLTQKVVIIDDPISSLDDHRALATVQEIRRLAERAGQVVVLSHNKQFLCRLWEGTDATARAAIELIRDGAGSSLREWHVAQDSITEHDRRTVKLRTFLTSGGGDMRGVARFLRPHLEAFFRVACPEWFKPGTLLGSFSRLCHQRLDTSEEILDRPTIQELDEIVEYANRFHHDTNPAWETEAINDGELRGFAQRVLTLCRPKGA